MEKEMSIEENGENKPTDHSSDSQNGASDQEEPEVSLKVSEVQTNKEQSDITVKSEASESEMILESCNSLKRVSVPNNILFLKRLDEEDANIAGRSCLLFSAIPLPSGSCIGPFKGEIVSLSSIKQGDLVLQVRRNFFFIPLILLAQTCKDLLLRLFTTVFIFDNSILYLKFWFRN